MTAQPQDDVALTFFGDVEARTVEAIAERIIPGDAENAGATQAGVVYYVDRAVSGFSTDLQPVYRRGLRALDVLCRHEHGAPFTDLSAEQQDAVVRSLIGPEVTAAHEGLQFSQDDQSPHANGGPPAVPSADLRLLRRLFAVVREHTVEGFFCDPAYGGNRDAVGWKLVGFPGAHWGYTAEQMTAGYDGRAVPIQTLSDLRQQLRSLPPNEVFTRDGER